MKLKNIWQQTENHLVTKQSNLVTTAGKIKEKIYPEMWSKYQTSVKQEKKK